jgi:hypothetical protein
LKKLAAHAVIARRSRPPFRGQFEKDQPDPNAKVLAGGQSLMPLLASIDPQPHGAAI